MKAVVAPWGSRLKAQLAGLAIFNSYFWSPVGKGLCVPVLSCYACPIATTACPIGTITAFALVRQIPYYVIGSLALVGASVGRAFCGWACPFGFLQDLMYRIRSPKWRLPRAANWLKYALLLGLVIAAPLALGSGKSASGSTRVVQESAGAIDYCALICPAGTLTAGLPGLAVNPQLWETTTWKSYAKIGLLVLILALVVVSRRSFCRALCPLGASMALASRISLLELRTEPGKCTRCMQCAAACPTDCREVPESSGRREATAECVMCLDCVRQCPEAEALTARFAGKSIMTSGARARQRKARRELAGV